MKKILALLLALVMIFSITACGNEETGNDTSLKVVAAMASDGYNPNSATLILDRGVASALYTPFCYSDVQGNIYSDLLDWELSEDGMTYTFTVKEGIKFSDGVEVTAKDCIFTIDTLLTDALGGYWPAYCGDYAQVDDYSFTVDKLNFFVDPLSLFAGLPIFVIPEHVYGSGAEDIATTAVGSGPYVLDRKEADGTFYLTANPNYYGGEVAYKELVICSPIDSSTQLVALETGELDALFDIPLSAMDTVKANDKLQLSTYDTSTSLCLRFHDNGLQGDLNLRQAIVYAINRDAIIKASTNGLGTRPVADIINTNQVAVDAYGSKMDTLKGSDYNVETAKEYLAKSNYKAGTPITITCDESCALQAQLIQADLIAIGIDAKIEQIDYVSFLTRNNSDFQVWLGTSGNVGVTLVDMLTQYSSADPTLGQFTANSEKMDNILAQIMSTTDSAALTDLVTAAFQECIDNATHVDIYNYVGVMAANKNVGGFDSSVIGVGGYLAFDKLHPAK